MVYPLSLGWQVHAQSERRTFQTLTFRFAFEDGADVGVIVTDGVIVRFEPVLDWPYGERCDGPPVSKRCVA